MFVYITGGILLISCTIVSLYSSRNNIEKKDNNQDNNEDNKSKQSLNNGVIQIPYNAEDITFSMCNNPNDPNYIGHLLYSEKKGSQYNL
jgi:hypothetical protein